MAGGIVINGRVTARPGIYSNIEYITIPSAPTQGTVLAVVGEFPFLEQGVPYLSTSQKDFDALAPSSPLLKKLSSIIYNPFRDAVNSAAPAQVYLMSPVGNEQAFGSFGGSGLVDVKAKQWGTLGNKTRFRIVPNAALGGWNVTVSNNGVQENIRVPSEPAAFTLDYDSVETPSASYPVRGYGDWGDDPVSQGSVSASVGVVAQGTVRVSFDRSLSAEASSTNASALAWVPAAPAYGTITAVGYGSTDLAGGSLTVRINGINSATGETAQADLVFANNGALTTPQTTTVVFSSISDVRLVLASGATMSAGFIRLTGQVFPDFNEANGQKFAGDVMRYVQPYSADGFTISTTSSRVSGILLTSLDKVLDDNLPVSATLDGYKIVSTVNNASRLVTLERGNVEAPAIASDEPGFFLSGGTETNPVLVTDWSDALSELVWYNIDVLCAFYDPTGTTPSEDVILPEFIDHLGTMWSDGANERTLWTGAGVGETMTTLVQRAALFNSERVNLVADSAYIQQQDGSTELMAPYWHALMHAAADASQLTVDSLTRARLRVLGTSRDDSLYSKEAMNDLIQAGLIIAFTPPGGVPRIEREVTTWTQDTNPARTEAICTRSVRASTKAMRAALEDLLNPGGGVRVLADVVATVRAELQRQSTGLYPLITGYDNASVSIVEEADRYEIGYVITVRINKNFITLNVGVTVPAGSV